MSDASKGEIYQDKGGRWRQGGRWIRDPAAPPVETKSTRKRKRGKRGSKKPKEKRRARTEPRTEPFRDSKGIWRDRFGRILAGAKVDTKDLPQELPPPIRSTGGRFAPTSPKDIRPTPAQERATTPYLVVNSQTYHQFIAAVFDAAPSGRLRYQLRVSAVTEEDGVPILFDWSRPWTPGENLWVKWLSADLLDELQKAGMTEGIQRAVFDDIRGIRSRADLESDAPSLREASTADGSGGKKKDLTPVVWRSSGAVARQLSGPTPEVADSDDSLLDSRTFDPVVMRAEWWR